MHPETRQAPTALLLAGLLGLAAASQSASPLFESIPASSSGLDFVHDHGGSGLRYMVETTGSGLAWLDFDGDGWSDLYLVQGAPLGGARRDRPPTDRLYRNLGGQRFVDVTERAGIDERGYGQGVAVSDYDRDGDLDLYVVNFGPNVLWRNNGDGTFTDVAGLAGVADPSWGSSAAFGDLTGDGWPDLYVANYVDFDLDHHLFCGDVARQIRTYCPPDVYGGLPDKLYVQRADGTFADESVSSRIDNPAGKGLGVLLSDLDGDGDLDVYVANDKTPNFLYQNDGRGRLREVATLVGAAYSGDGLAQAGMGVDSGDTDGDGDFDLVVTNFYFEGIAYLVNAGDGFFEDDAQRGGLLTPSLRAVGFGAVLVDVDNDGDLDLVTVNGHIMDNIALLRPEISYAQRPVLYRNQGGRFDPLGPAESGAPFGREVVARGLAQCDFDNDGDLDLAMTLNNGPVMLLRNRGGGGRSLSLRLRSAGGDAIPVGAKVKATIGDATLVRELKGGGSYQSAPDSRLHFGLGNATGAELVVEWLGGNTESLGRIEADGLLLIQQGRGLVGRRRLGEAHR